MSFLDKITTYHKNPKASEEALNLQLRRIEQRNSELNAFTYITNLSKDQQQMSSLAGLSFCAKDNIQVHNRPLSFGLSTPLIKKASEHAAVIEFFLDRGAAFLGSTNLDEACLDYFGFNTHHGKVLNPTYPDRITGGSSSGSAAAVAAELVDFSIGSDFGGSVRIPAAACSICGIKLTKNILPSTGSVLYDSQMDSLGLFAKNLDDLGFLVSSILGTKLEISEPNELKIFYPASTDLAGLNDNFKGAFKGIVSTLSHSYDTVEIPKHLSFSQCNAARKILAAKAVASFVSDSKLSSSKLPKVLQAVCLLNEQHTKEELNKAQQTKDDLAIFAAEQLSTNTFILSPALLKRTPKVVDVLDTHNLDLNLEYYLTMANLGGLPALVFPTRIKDKDFYFPLQLIGSRGSDLAVIQTAQAIIQPS